VTVLVIAEMGRLLPRIKARRPGRRTTSTMKSEPPDSEDRSRIVVTLEAPAWLWGAAVVGAIVVNAIWWVIAK
jgi:hypothetical protein